MKERNYIILKATLYRFVLKILWEVDFTFSGFVKYTREKYKIPE